MCTPVISFNNIFNGHCFERLLCQLENFRRAACLVTLPHLHSGRILCSWHNFISRWNQNFCCCWTSESPLLPTCAQFSYWCWKTCRMIEDRLWNKEDKKVYWRGEVGWICKGRWRRCRWGCSVSRRQTGQALVTTASPKWSGVYTKKTVLAA